jgi:hypothetical protein
MMTVTALQRRTKLKILKPTILALTLTMLMSSPALGGNIAGLRTTGNIGGMRSTGNIGGTRSANIVPRAVGRNENPAASHFGTETTISSTFAGLLRMLLESGALL